MKMRKIIESDIKIKSELVDALKKMDADYIRLNDKIIIEIPIENLYDYLMDYKEV